MRGCRVYILWSLEQERGTQYGKQIKKGVALMMRDKETLNPWRGVRTWLGKYLSALSHSTTDRLRKKEPWKAGANARVASLVICQLFLAVHVLPGRELSLSLSLFLSFSLFFRVFGKGRLRVSWNSWG
ncbi:hypothetical protein BD289DRAFT_424194 [Coniella lustricola]|uniref:Uncharacterized protein n=1 Tax=Coniella lustricola TaxID=2025994 RepID=A0A2T3AIX8_9PEZI|nr:hypothetical protein BD289DRAFT_424194 [Coniella lustricola]